MGTPSVVAKLPHAFQAHLVVGATAPDEDAHVVRQQPVPVLLQRHDDAVERVGHVGEVGDAAAD